MSRTDEEWVLKPNAYSGTLVIGGETHAVSFSAEVGKDHRCVVKMNPVEKGTYLLLHRNFGRLGLPQEHFELTGTASNGDMLTSKEAWIRRLGANDDGFNVELSFHRITASIGLPKKQVRPVLRRWFRSFRSFRNSIQHTPLGDARVYGTEKSIDKDEVSGCVAIQTTSEFEIVSWRENAEAFLSHMHTGLVEQFLTLFFKRKFRLLLGAERFPSRLLVIDACRINHIRRKLGSVFIEHPQAVSGFEKLGPVRHDIGFIQKVIDPFAHIVKLLLIIHQGIDGRGVVLVQLDAEFGNLFRRRKHRRDQDVRVILRLLVPLFFLALFCCSSKRAILSR